MLLTTVNSEYTTTAMLSLAAQWVHFIRVRGEINDFFALGGEGSGQILSSKKPVYQEQPIIEQEINNTIMWDWRGCIGDPSFNTPVFFYQKKKCNLFPRAQKIPLTGFQENLTFITIKM